LNGNHQCAFKDGSVTLSDKPVLRPNSGRRLRLRTKTARQRFLETDVTSEEHKQILDYCLKNKISVSQFLADLILEDVAQAKTRKTPLRIKPELEFTPEEYDKLELLSYLQGKSSIRDLIRELLRPHLELQRIHGQAEKKVRLYLSDREHEIVLKHLASRGITARKYVSFLAIKKIRKSHKLGRE
jgi:hypothetical protein